MSVQLDAVAMHLAVADRAGLVALDAHNWMITEAGSSWLLQPSSTRWALLAAAWLDALPGDIRHLLSERTTVAVGLRPAQLHRLALPGRR